MDQHSEQLYGVFRQSEHVQVGTAVRVGVLLNQSLAGGNIAEVEVVH